MPIKNVLKPRELLFIRALFTDAAGNQTRAAELAGSSPSSAHTIAWRLMKRPEISSIVGELNGLSEEDRIQYLNNLDKSATHDSEEIKRVPKNTIDVKRAISQEAVAEKQTGVATRVEIKKFLTDLMRGEVADARPVDRLRAAEVLGKAKGMFLAIKAKTNSDTPKTHTFNDDDLEKLSVDELRVLESIIDKMGKNQEVAKEEKADPISTVVDGVQ